MFKTSCMSKKSLNLVGIICCLMVMFINVNNVYAYKIEFQQAWGEYLVATCYTTSDGRISSNCINVVTDVCERWTVYPKQGSESELIKKNQCKWRYSSYYEQDVCWDKRQWDNSLNDDGLEDFVFTEDDIYYCVAGSSKDEGTWERNACYQCKTNENIKKWSADGTAGDANCSDGYIKTNLTKEQCVDNNVCYVCKDDNNIRKWSNAIPTDTECPGGFQEDASISQSDCNTRRACYVCMDTDKGHVMKWSTNGNKDDKCSGYQEDSSISEESDCDTRDICYVCKDNQNIMRWSKNGDKDSSCSSGYKPTTIAETECNSAANLLTCDSVSTSADGNWGANQVTKNSTSCETGDLEANFKSCAKKTNIGTTSNPNNNYYYIYVLSNVQKNECSGAGGSRVKIGDKYYVKVAVDTDVLFNQNANFRFGGIVEDVVRAGKGFTIGETEYGVIITWLNANLNSNGNPYYRYSYAEYVSGSCSKIDTSFNLKNKTYYYYDSANNFVSTNDLAKASYEVVKRGVNHSIKSKNDSVNNIKFKSCDSNDSSSCDVPSMDVEGIWDGGVVSNDVMYGSNFTAVNLSVNKNSMFGSRIGNRFFYGLSNSAVSVAGDSYAKALYAQAATDAINANTAIGTGNKFYVDFRWIDDRKWPFDLARDVDPSFVSGIKWTLNGTCGVNVSDGYYKEIDGTGELGLAYKYRSISLENPFPKSDTLGFAINWKDWYSSIANQSRIRNTYSNGLKYMVLLSKFGGGSTVKISSINANKSNYVDLIGFERNGTSSFVVNNFYSKQNYGNKSFCELGYFSKDCDKYTS